MIRSFRHKGLVELFGKGSSAKVRAELRARVVRRLDALDAAHELSELNIPGFNFHPLRGYRPTRYSIHINGPWCIINGPWCITFEWADGDAFRVDLEQYH